MKKSTEPLPAASDLPDIKTGYYGIAEINTAAIRDLCAVADGAALILGFASPDFPLADVASTIKRELAPKTKLILMYLHGAANLLSNDSRPYRRLIGNTELRWIRLSRTNNGIGHLFIEFQILDHNGLPHLYHIGAAVALDDITVADLCLQIDDLTFQEGLFVLRILVLRVLAQISQSNGCFEPLCDFNAFDTL